MKNQVSEILAKIEIDSIEKSINESLLIEQTEVSTINDLKKEYGKLKLGLQKIEKSMPDSAASFNKYLKDCQDLINEKFKTIEIADAKNAPNEQQLRDFTEAQKSLSSFKEGFRNIKAQRLLPDFSKLKFRDGTIVANYSDYDKIKNNTFSKALESTSELKSPLESAFIDAKSRVHSSEFPSLDSYDPAKFVDDIINNVTIKDVIEKFVGKNYLNLKGDKSNSAENVNEEKPDDIITDDRLNASEKLKKIIATKIFKKQFKNADFLSRAFDNDDAKLDFLKKILTSST